MKKTLFFALLLGSMLLVACNEKQQEPSQSCNEKQQEPSQSEENKQGDEQKTEKVSGNGTLQGHDYVDLGLPLGTLWATCNVGANTPEAYGDYFAWGETSPKQYYDWSSYQYGTAYNKLTKYCNNSNYGLNGFTDNKTVLDAEDDAATVNWGSGWRMPTLDEIMELTNNTTSTLTTQNGVKGYKFTASNGNSIFLPAAGDYYDGSGPSGAGNYGDYWSSSLNTDIPNCACYLGFNSGRVYWDGYCSRLCGQSVRPVVNVDPNTPYLSLTPSRKVIETTGGNFTVNITSNVAWSVTCNKSWVTLSATSGSGNGSFSVLVAANETTTPDNATITVTTATGGASQTVTIARGCISGTLQGHDYIDLGLPSGTLWATCNVGANTPETYGDYFAWGETTPKSTYNWSTYQYGSSFITLTKYCNNSSDGLNGFTDNKTVLDAEDDAATVNWGSGWRMPTLDEIEELRDNTTSTWTTQNGVYGRKFTASNGNSIFLPAAGYYYGSSLRSAGDDGYYWSSSLGTDDQFFACYLGFNSGRVYWDDYYPGYRYYGLSVRPVVNR